MIPRFWDLDIAVCEKSTDAGPPTALKVKPQIQSQLICALLQQIHEFGKHFPALSSFRSDNFSAIVTYAIEPQHIRCAALLGGRTSGDQCCLSAFMSFESVTTMET